MQIILEDTTESWKAESLEKPLEKIKKGCNHKTPRKESGIHMGQKGLVLFGDANSGVDSRNKVSLYLLGPLF